MFASLDTTDGKRGDAVVLVDDRTAAEIEVTPAVSVLFALSRIARARETGGKVVYVCKHTGLPGFFVDAIAAGGASLEAGKQAVKLPAAALAAEDLADRTFRELAAQTARRLGVTDGFDSAIEKLELDLRARTIVKDADEVGFWTGVVELTALAGEVVRARHGGRWRKSRESGHRVPFELFVGPGVFCRPAPIAEETARGGMSVRKVIDAVDRAAVRLRELAAAPIACQLRARREVDGWAWRPLWAGAPDAPDMPVAVYGRVMPEAFAIAHDDEDAADLHARALPTIAEQQVEITEFTKTYLVIAGGDYATAKLLDRAFLRTLHARMGAPTLYAMAKGIGVVAVTTDRETTERLADSKLLEVTKPLSTRVIVIADGELSGDSREPASKPGLFRRLFGRGGSREQ